ncbi:unnamed protein product [Rhizoctonia solani]|uniref:Uncharacterized protein n=1 Tax=Rhizoctonia solani TaxID=456999 RepID=A0A8H3BSR0_9AGAM|nr:unnamed protein product [Rhizoctonia solani]
MTDDNVASSSQRRLVVCFFDEYERYSTFMVDDDKNNRPQLFHQQKIPWYWKPSRTDRLIGLLRLNQQNKSIAEEAAAGAHRFICDNYRPGDEVILMVDDYGSNPHPLEAAEILAQHLDRDIRPAQYRQMRLGDARISARQRIPVHCIAVYRWGDHQESICIANDQMKFPPGIQHFIVGGWSHNGYWSCSTTCDLGGGMIAREICCYTGDVDWSSAFIFATKHIIYWKPEWTQDWEKISPVWTHPHNSPNATEDGYPSEMELPVGMYRHELNKYGDLPARDQGGNRVYLSVLVWKSSRC